MALDDIVDEVEEEAKAVDEEEYKNFAERFALISQIVVTLDKRVEELEKEVERLRDDEGDSFLDDETGGGSDSSWQ